MASIYDDFYIDPAIADGSGVWIAPPDAGDPPAYEFRVRFAGAKNRRMQRALSELYDAYLALQPKDADPEKPIVLTDTSSIGLVIAFLAENVVTDWRGSGLVDRAGKPLGKYTEKACKKLLADLPSLTEWLFRIANDRGYLNTLVEHVVKN